MIQLKLTEVSRLKENQIVAEPVMTDDFQILLNKGTILKSEYIDKLKELGIREVYIEDDFGSLQNPLPELSKEEAEKYSVRIKESCSNKIKEILKHHIYSQGNKLSELKESANEILDEILSEPELVQNICEIRERKPDIYDHTLNLCSMCMLIALRMDLDRNDIRQLGTAALLHDLGLRYTTAKYENVDLSSLPEEDQEEYKKHTVYGYSAISEMSWLTEQEKKMILFHHENLAGLGYPLHSEQLSVLTQILAVCEIMDEMICGIGYKKRKIWEVLSYLEGIKGKYYYSEIIDTICAFIVRYPVGTKLILNDGSVGIVVKQNDNNSQRPIVQIIKKGEKTKDISMEAVTLINLEKDTDYSVLDVQEH